MYETNNMTEETKVMDAAIEAIEAGAKASNNVVGKILLGVVGVVATVATIALGVSAVNKHKTNKELNTPEEGQIVEPTEEQIFEVTKAE